MEADLSSAEFYEWLDDFDTEIKNERKIVIVSPPSASNVSYYYNCYYFIICYSQEK